MSSSNAIITKKSREKMVKARAGALGGALPSVVGMAFGDGGVDGEGHVLEPAESQSTLNHQLLRKPIDGYSFPEQTSCLYKCTLAENELAGESISEIGLYDTDGDLICIKNFTPKGKDADTEQTYTLKDIF